MSSEFHEPSYEAVIPASILTNENIEMYAVKLFAFIKSLTRAHGYCFATNEYLAKLMKSTTRSVQRWLIMLKKEGYVDIETHKNGIHWQRLIYVSDRFKKSLRRDFCVTPPRHTCHPPMTHVSPILKDYSKEDNSKEETPPNPLKGETVLYGKFVQLTKEEYLDLSVLCGGNEILNSLIDEINDYLSSTGKKPYRDYAATIRNWWRRRKTNPLSNGKQIVDNNRKLAQKIKDTLRHEDILIQPDSLIFINRANGGDLVIKYTENGFREQVISRLLKMGLPTKEL